MLGARQVVLEWPESMRIGEQEQISLIFEPMISETTGFDQSDAGTDIYSAYNVMAEAKFEVAGVMVKPTNPIRASMPSGQTVKFRWQISADQVGSYDGQVWLSLRLLPLDGSLVSEVPVYIRELKMQTATLFGMTEAMAYLVGGAGVVISFVIEYGDVIRWIHKRKRKKTTKERKITTKDAKDTKDKKEHHKGRKGHEG